MDEEILPNAFEWESAGSVPDSARDHLTSVEIRTNTYIRHLDAMLSSDTWLSALVYPMLRFLGISHMKSGTRGTP